MDPKTIQDVLKQAALNKRGMSNHNCLFCVGCTHAQIQNSLRTHGSSFAADVGHKFAYQAWQCKATGPGFPAVPMKHEMSSGIFCLVPTDSFFFFFFAVFFKPSLLQVSSLFDIANSRPQVFALAFLTSVYKKTQNIY